LSSETVCTHFEDFVSEQFCNNLDTDGKHLPAGKAAKITMIATVAMTVSVNAAAFWKRKRKVRRRRW
jgi:hypothetical protein